MKKIGILWVTLILLLCGCSRENRPENITTDPPANTTLATEEEPPETTQPVIADNSDELDVQWLRNLEIAFAKEPFRGMPRNYYHAALNVYFSAPEEIDLYRFLCYGTGNAQDRDLTAEELAALEAYPKLTSAMENTDTFVYRYRKRTVQELLDTCFQVSLEEVNTQDANLVYLPETDCYYVVWHMVGPAQVEILEGEYLSRGEDGQVIRFTYRDGGAVSDTVYEAVVSTVGGFHVVSNREVAAS